MADDSTLLMLLRTIADRDLVATARALGTSPELVRAGIVHGATRQRPKAYFLEGILHHVYEGDTALHVAAAAHAPEVVRDLLARGSDVGARNRRGAQPLHYAADGGPAWPAWNPAAQAATVALLVEAGADPNSVDRSGVAPLHRAVRTRCALAVQALLEVGADARRRNGSGSTPMQLATRHTGRGGSGSAEARAQQAEIVRLLEAHGAVDFA